MSKVRLIQFYAYTYDGNDFAFTARQNIRKLWDIRDNDGNLVMENQATLPELDTILAAFVPVDKPDTDDAPSPESKDEFTDQ